MPEHIIIIGNGVAGVTAARVIRKLSDRRITIVSDEAPYFFSRTGLMYVFMGHMKRDHLKPYEDQFWADNGIDRVMDRVSTVEPDSKQIRMESGQRLSYDRLVIATGSAPRIGPWEGVELDGCQGFYHLSDLDRLTERARSARRAVVIGGGLIGVELAEMLHSRGLNPRFLVRESGFMDHVFPKEESSMIEREIRRHGIDLRLDAHVAEIEGDAGRVSAVRTADGEHHPADLVASAIGVRPNVAWLIDSDIEIAEGVLVDDGFRSSARDVYAIGDCAEFRTEGVGHRRIEQLWYTARRHGTALGHIICGARGAYKRGIYFNSAKFFTIEHQVYGDVAPVPLDGEGTWFREGSTGRSSIRINYDLGTQAVRGFLLMGTRFRQDVCERWIREGATLDLVRANLDSARFDPEFVRPDAARMTALA